VGELPAWQQPEFRSQQFRKRTGDGLYGLEPVLISPDEQGRRSEPTKCVLDGTSMLGVEALGHSDQP
jgi:hypothetical protein